MISLENNKIKSAVKELNQKTAEKTKMFVTVKEFSDLTGIKEHSIRTIIRIKGFPAIRIGTKNMVLVDEGMEWLRLHAGNLDTGRRHSIV